MDNPLTPELPRTAGDWIATYTGRKWYITNPRAEDVCIEDIAHHLSLICRYGGACREFYSVAEHSVRMTEELERHSNDVQLLFWCLLHDAAEAYLGDMVRPLKLSIPAYRDLEFVTEIVVMEGLKLPDPTVERRKIVKEMDDILLMTERRDLVNHCGHEWTPRAEPLTGRISPWSPTAAEHRFLATYYYLTSL